ncbi:MAG: hypothetical protein GY723_08415 [bacterium]|nr:hypothetical protein [bacterium]MCP5071398.1 hypothetical protein [bacterium]
MPTCSRGFDDALEDLAREGLNWLAYVPASQGPKPPPGLPASEGRGLLLLLSFGSSFGRRTGFEEGSETDPFDRRSAELAESLLDDWLRPGDPEARRVYPGGPALDLRAWLAAGGVQHDAPIRTGIRPDSGPWLAVRAALWTAIDPGYRQAIARRYPPLGSEASPCVACQRMPCIDACPGGALAPLAPNGEVDPQAGGLDSCIRYRLRPDSPCAERCPARLACPIGSSFRYDDAQLRYHYRVSLRALQAWRAEHPETAQP